MDVKISDYWGGYPSAGGATAGYLVDTGDGDFELMHKSASDAFGGPVDLPDASQLYTL